MTVAHRTTDLDLAAIKARDAKVPAFVFEIGYEAASAGFTECAQDRRVLIAEVERLCGALRQVMAASDPPQRAYYIAYEALRKPTDG